MTVQQKCHVYIGVKDFIPKKEILDKEGSDCRMVISKDTEKGTWTSQIWVED